MTVDWPSALALIAVVAVILAAAVTGVRSRPGNAQFNESELVGELAEYHVRIVHDEAGRAMVGLKVVGGGRTPTYYLVLTSSQALQLAGWFRLAVMPSKSS